MLFTVWRITICGISPYERSFGLEVCFVSNQKGYLMIFKKITKQNMCLKMSVKDKPTISFCHLFVLPPLVNTSVNMLQAYLFNFLSFHLIWPHLQRSASFHGRCPVLGPRYAPSDTLMDTAANQWETFMASVSRTSASDWLLRAGPCHPEP